MDPPTSQSPITTALSTQVTSVSTSSTPSFQSISSTFGSGYPKEFPRASKKEFQKPSSAHLQDEGPSHPFASMGSASIGFSFAKAFQKEKDQSPVAERKLDISLGKECQKSDLAAGSGKPESPFSFVKTLQRTKDDIHGRTGDVSAKSHSSPKSRLPERSRHMHSTKRRPSKSSLFSKALADVSSSHQKSPRQETRRRGNTISEPRVRHTSEIQDITTIICINVPDELNKKEMLLGHFERFGNVTRIKCNLQKQRTVIEFQDHKSALAAKQKGGKVAGRTLEIYWSEKASKRPMPMKDNTFSSEVDEELKAMSGSIEEPRLLTRPEELTESKGSGSSKKSQRKPPVKPTSTFSSSTDISKKPIPKTTLASSTAPIKRKPETSSQPSLLKKAEASTSSKETVIATDVSEESLLLLLSSPASTVTEKFYVLDARDKLMRLKQHKQSDIKFAKAAVGVCPDMCPEKERYCRSFKCGLSIFELKKLNNCQMPDHSAMVKEYSRSSADQEEPLPHELRPSYVLVSTMNHLLCNVINALDEGSASAGDWYDFIWNRTRAIRKDITQQHMCDLTSVELVEKCARFHIHCSAALCEEDMAVFDFKINNENLTKCLQTLRHFYHDLGVKGIFCPNEAEFRCYDVLINLNEGDILREVQKLHPRIWDSPEIKFAIKTFSALNSNNYVQFFRLVQEACYLNSCILHRYFTQVRSQAVMVVLKAFCIPNHSGLYPIEDFIRVLAFDDETEATNFCKRFGLETQDRHVVLNRSMLNPPSGMPYMQRSKKLVESKKTCSLAEVINAGPLPQNPLLSYTPHSSFDSQGYLKKEAYDAGDQISKVMKQALSHREDSSIVLDVSNVPEIQHDETDFLGQYKDISDIEEEDSLLREEKETSYEELPYSDDVGKNIVEDFTEEVIQSEIRTISADYVRLQKLSQAVSNSLLEELLTEFLCEISQEVVMAERNFLAEKARKEAEERRINNMMRDRVVATIAEELTEEVLMDELCATAKDELRKFTEEFITNMSIMVCHDLLDEMVSEELQTLAEQVFHQEVLMYEKMMKMIEKHIQKKLTKRYFKRWKNFYIARRQLKQARLLFPPCPPLFPKQEIGVSLRKRKPPLELTFTSNKRTSLCLDAKLCTNLLEEEVAWLPLPLKNIVKTFLAKKCTECHQTSLRWTLMVIFPIISPPSSNQIQNWIQRKFSEKRHPNVDLKNKENELVSVIHSSEVVFNERHILHFQVKAIWKPPSPEEFKKLKGEKMLSDISSLLVIFPVSLTPEETSKKIQEQVKTILDDRLQPLSACFVPVLTYDCQVHNVTLWTEKLQSIFTYTFQASQWNQLISPPKTVLIQNINSSAESQKLESSVHWLIVNAPPFPDVLSKPLKWFLHEGLSTFVFSPVYENFSELTKLGCYEQDVDAIIELYNCAVKHLANVAGSATISSFHWCFEQDEGPNWNSRRKLQSLRQIVSSLILPHFEGSLRNASEIVQDDVYNFVLTIVSKKLNDSYIPVIVSRLKDILERYGRPLIGNTGIIAIPWAEIIVTLSNFMVESLDILGEDVNQTFVYYVESEYWEFSFPVKWIKFMQEAKNFSKELHSAYPESQEGLILVEKALTENESPTSLGERAKDLTTLEEAALGKYSTFEKEAIKEQENSKRFSELLSHLLEEGKSISSAESLSMTMGSPPSPHYYMPENPKVAEEPATRAPTPPDSVEQKLHMLKSKLDKLKASHLTFNHRLQQLMEDNEWQN